MSFYENTIITKQDLPKSELNKIKDKYNDLINNNSGKVIKIEEWGLLNLARKIKRYNNSSNTAGPTADPFGLFGWFGFYKDFYKFILDF